MAPKDGFIVCALQLELNLNAVKIPATTLCQRTVRPQEEVLVPMILWRCSGSLVAVLTTCLSVVNPSRKVPEISHVRLPTFPPKSV